MAKLLTTAYFPPISYFAAIAEEMEGLVRIKGEDRRSILSSPLSPSIIYIEACENYQKQSYRNRCHFYAADGIQSLSFPIVHEGNTHKRPISEVKIDYSTPWVMQHKRGDSKTMQSMTDYEDVVDDVIAFFEEFAVKAEANGVKDWILDPGFGFAKTVSQNYQMMRNLRKFRRPYPSCPRPKILVGVSRKSMIYKALSITPEESLPQTQVLHLKALQEGADMLRVHDIAEAKRTVEVYWRLC